MAVYIGIDWSAAKHDVCVLNENGGVIATTVLPHTADGLFRLEALRQKLGVAPTECLIGIETAHTLVIDFLWARDYSQVYVIPPNVVKSRRGRYRQSEAGQPRAMRCSWLTCFGRIEHAYTLGDPIPCSPNSCAIASASSAILHKPRYACPIDCTRC
jgi:hypothetical protein